jgi:hypothetical protein
MKRGFLDLLDPSNDPEFVWQVISGPPCIAFFFRPGSESNPRPSRPCAETDSLRLYSTQKGNEVIIISGASEPSQSYWVPTGFYQGSDIVGAQFSLHIRKKRKKWGLSFKKKCM